MDQPLFFYSGLVLLATFVSAVSQVILKKAALKERSSKISEYLNFPVVFAYVLFFASTLMCIIAYRVVPLSFGPVLESTSYIYVTMFGVVFFKEKITPLMVFALALILAGICVYSLGI